MPSIEAKPVPLVEPRLITTKEAARQLSVSTWEIRRLCRKGLLAYRKLSKTNWLITTASVKAFANCAVQRGVDSLRSKTVQRVAA